MNTISLKHPRAVFIITFIDISVRACSILNLGNNRVIIKSNDTKNPSTITFYINSVSVNHFDMQFVIVEWNKEWEITLLRQWKEVLTSIPEISIDPRLHFI